jgi:hypothetical protein
LSQRRAAKLRTCVRTTDGALGASSLVGPGEASEGQRAQQRAAEQAGQTPHRLSSRNALGQRFGQVIKSVLHEFLLSCEKVKK